MLRTLGLQCRRSRWFGVDCFKVFLKMHGIPAHFSDFIKKVRTKRTTAAERCLTAQNKPQTAAPIKIKKSPAEIKSARLFGSVVKNVVIFHVHYHASFTLAAGLNAIKYPIIFNKEKQFCIFVIPC